MLFDDLISEYRVFRRAMSAGARPSDLSDITVNEHAGMYLALFDWNALVNYDQVEQLSGAHLKGTRELIEKAIDERREEGEL